MKHLWEVDHEYYCSSTNWFSNEMSFEFASWDSFMKSYGESDMDLNLVFRWDWGTSESDNHNELSLFIMQQRKGLFATVTIAVERSDETAITEWLKPRCLHLMKLWEPLEGTE